MITTNRLYKILLTDSEETVGTYVRYHMEANRYRKSRIRQEMKEWTNCYIRDWSFARRIREDICTAAIAPLFYEMPNTIYIDDVRQALATFVQELEKLTDNVFDGTALLNLDKVSYSGSDRVEPIPVSEIIASLNYATDIVTISQIVLGPPVHTRHARQIDPKHINNFQSNGGVEMVKALSQGVAIEDIISI